MEEIFSLVFLNCVSMYSCILSNGSWEVGFSLGVSGILVGDVSDVAPELSEWSAGSATSVLETRRRLDSGGRWRPTVVLFFALVRGHDGGFSDGFLLPLRVPAAERERERILVLVFGVGVVS